MARYCVICRCVRSNESFRGGKGPKSRICRKCLQLPKADRAARQHEREIMGFLEQAHISKKNLAQLRTLAQEGSAATRSLAARALDIGTLTPYRHGRIRSLAAQRPDLVQWMEEIGLSVPPPPEVEADALERVPGFGYLHLEEQGLVRSWYKSLDEEEHNNEDDVGP